MTIPTRPAPAPPGSRAQNAAAGANESLEQLRRQLQQQQQHQQQSGNIQRLTIALPPPPKIPTNQKFGATNNNNSSSITRHFPKARYTPTTDWDDSPFTSANATVNNGNYKKVPPPRPPPPKVQVNGRKMVAPTPPTRPTNKLTSLFQRKKAASKNNNTNQSRVYGLSSGNSSSTTITTQHSFSNSLYNANSSTDWNAVWNTTSSNGFTHTSKSITTSTNSSTVQEAQLISFDSPPSSPTFTQKSNSDCVSVDSFSSDSNFSSPNNGSVSQPESGFEDDFAASRSRPSTTSPLDPWETLDAFSSNETNTTIGTAPVRNLNAVNTRVLASQDNPLCNGKSLLPPTPSLTMPTIIKPKISQKPKAPKPPPVSSLKMQNRTGASILNSDLNTPPSPPMPQCAPPPLPQAQAGFNGFSMLDVISGKVDALQLNSANSAFDGETRQQPYGIALYDFEGAEEGDLCFRENEKIYLLEEVSEEWYRGRTRTGCEGIFPANYIDIIVPLPSSLSAQYTPAANTGGTYTHRVRCLYNFPAEVQGDLALKENDFVTILYRINEDWLYGEIDGKRGQFPSNFLEYIPENIPMP